MTRWDSFYEKGKAPQYPSQFAAFVLQEVIEEGDKEVCVFDIGCGNGRDTLFFHRNDIKASGYDPAGPDTLHRYRLDPLLEPPRVFYKNQWVYARFFLHSISLDEENLFWSLVSKTICGSGKCAVEFRTFEDEKEYKEYSDHERRYLCTNDVIERAGKYGLTPTYAIEGKGMANFRKEDPNVARIIFEKKIC